MVQIAANGGLSRGAATVSVRDMKTLEDIQLAITVLPTREWLEMNRWIDHFALPHRTVIREAPAVYGITPALAALQVAVRKLDCEQLRELCDWMQPDEPCTPDPSSFGEDFLSVEEA